MEIHHSVQACSLSVICYALKNPKTVDTGRVHLLIKLFQGCCFDDEIFCFDNDDDEDDDLMIRT